MTKVLLLLQLIAVDKMEKNLYCGNFRLTETFMSSSIITEKKSPRRCKNTEIYLDA